MTNIQSLAWRLCFALTGLLILAGGPQHPSGTMAEMLAHPSWYRAHALVLGAYVALAAGLFFFERRTPLAPAMRRWARIAVVGTALQVVEMAVHTAAAVDHHNLVAGHATPVLSTHLAMTLVIYPLFAVTMAGFILAGVRARAIGHRWTAWLGIAGVVLQGTAPWLVQVFAQEWARRLFPMIILFALWTLITALAPRRAQAVTPLRAPAPLTAA